MSVERIDADRQLIAKQLVRFGVVNIGAVGTFVASADVSESVLRADYHPQLEHNRESREDSRGRCMTMQLPTRGSLCGKVFQISTALRDPGHATGLKELVLRC